MPSTISTPRRLLLHRIIEASASVALVIAIVLGVQYIGVTRNTLFQKIRQSDNVPLAALRQAELKTALANHAHDIERIQALFPPRDAVGDIVGRLEQEGQRHRIDVQIPVIKEELKLDKDRKPIPEAGPFVNVRLTIKAYGAPADILQFLHTVEHLPFILELPTWQFSSVSTAPDASLQARTSSGALETTTTTQGELTGSVLIKMKNVHEN